MRATVESHHAVTVYIPNVCTLLETSIVELELWNSNMASWPLRKCCSWHRMSSLASKHDWSSDHCFSISDKGENLLFILPKLSLKQALALNQHLIRLGQKMVNALWFTTKTAQERSEEDGKELMVSKEAPLWIRLWSVPTRHGQRTSPGGHVVFSTKGCWQQVLWVGRWMPPCIRLVTLGSLWGSCSCSGAVFLMCQSALCC